MNIDIIKHVIDTTHKNILLYIRGHVAFIAGKTYVQY